MVGDNVAGSVLLDVCTTTHSRENEEFCFGSIFVFFIMTVAAAEVAVGLAIIVMLYRQKQTVLVNELNQLKG